MKTCAFFGHRNGSYEIYRPYLKAMITTLIERYQVAQFYTGGRGSFDHFCASLVAEVKGNYPHIKNTLVYSYIPQSPESDRFASSIYDDSVYLLEKRDIVIVAVFASWGGAYNAYQYALRKKKKVFNLFDYFSFEKNSTSNGKPLATQEVLDIMNDCLKN